MSKSSRTKRTKIFATENDAMNWIDQMDKIYVNAMQVDREITQQRIPSYPSLNQSYGAGGYPAVYYEFQATYEVYD